MSDPALSGPSPVHPAGGVTGDPVLRALIIFLAGMALLLAIDLASEPRGRAGENRAIEAALAAGNGTLADVSQLPDGEESPEAAERRERAQSAAFFLEQASLAWRRGDATPPERIEAERTGTAALAFLNKLWAIGWLLLPLGMCPAFDGALVQWTLVPASALVALFFLGIDELAVQLEEPFSILPLEAMCDGIDGVAQDMGCT